MKRIQPVQQHFPDFPWPAKYPQNWSSHGFMAVPPSHLHTGVSCFASFCYTMLHSSACSNMVQWSQAANLLRQDCIMLAFFFVAFTSMHVTRLYSHIRTKLSNISWVADFLDLLLSHWLGSDFTTISQFKNPYRQEKLSFTKQSKHRAAKAGSWEPVKKIAMALKQRAARCQSCLNHQFCLHKLQKTQSASPRRIEVPQAKA